MFLLRHMQQSRWSMRTVYQKCSISNPRSYNTSFGTKPNNFFPLKKYKNTGVITCSSTWSRMWTMSTFISCHLNYNFMGRLSMRSMKVLEYCTIQPSKLLSRQGYTHRGYCMVLRWKMMEGGSIKRGANMFAAKRKVSLCRKRMIRLNLWTLLASNATIKQDSRMR